MPSKKLKAAGVGKNKFDRTVAAIKRSGSSANPYAVAESTLQKRYLKRRKKSREGKPRR
jgi:hypothetical protein